MNFSIGKRWRTAWKPNKQDAAPAAEPPKLITIRQACEKYSLARSTLYKMIASGAVTAFKLPGTRSTRLDEAEVAQLWRPVTNWKAREL